MGQLASRPNDMSERRKLIDNSYVAEWLQKGSDKQISQYATYAKEDITKGDIVMECMIPFEWLYSTTLQMKSYRIRVDYEDIGQKFIMPLGNILVMNYGNERDTNCDIIFPVNSYDRVITVRASIDIKKDDELRWPYRGDAT